MEKECVRIETDLNYLDNHLDYDEESVMSPEVGIQLSTNRT
jgi:hypothetical protein